MKGIVEWYCIKKGYGFIKGEDGKEVFFHKSEIPFWTIYLNKGDKVQYKKEATKKGLLATKIQVR